MKKFTKTILFSLTFCSGFSLQRASAMGAPDSAPANKKNGFVVHQLVRFALWVTKGDALFNVIFHNDVKGVQACIAAGADVNKPSHGDYTFSGFLDYNGLTSYNGPTPLMLATAHSKTESTIVQLLLENGAQPNLQLDDGTTALHCIAACSNSRYMRSDLIPKVKLLLAGTDPTIQTNSGDTPLHVVTKNPTIYRPESAIHPGHCSSDSLVSYNDSNQYETAKLLIPAMWRQRLALLSTAWRAAPLEICNLVISYDNPLDLQNNDGDTPLILASRNGQAQVVRLLLENGANPEIKNDQGHDVYYEAEHVFSDLEEEWPRQVQAVRAMVLAALGQ
ncbi:MAG: ankyrin repeat domain-containing protein [Candidatus Babeliales bacterium]|jgi:ankyrin repeat protein